MKTILNRDVQRGGGSCLNAPDEFSKGCKREKTCYNNDVLHHNYNEVCMKKYKINSAFTLAEMMVVMLILSIVMAAFAPVMTTRSKTDRNSPWRYASDNSNIYYGLGENQTAMIGQPRKNADLDPSSRLIINTSDDAQKHITFKSGPNTLLGNLFIDKYTLTLGDVTSTGSYNTALGQRISFSDSVESNVGLGYFLHSKSNNGILVGTNSSISKDSDHAIVIGDKISTSKTKNSIGIGSGMSINSAESILIGHNVINSSSSVSNVVTIGNGAEAASSNAVAIGTKSKALAVQGSSVAIGGNANADGSYGGAIAIGPHSNATQGAVAIGPSGTVTSTDDTLEYTTASNFSVALGYNASAAGSSVVIGSDSNSKGSDSVAIGAGVSVDNSNVSFNSTSSVAIGGSSHVGSMRAVALGAGANVTGPYAMALGSNTSASGDYSIAAGASASASGQGGIALGSFANAEGANNIAIGELACNNVTGSNKICIGKESGPRTSNDPQATDDKERIYIGSPGTFQPPQWTSTKHGNAVGKVTYHAPLEIHKNGDTVTTILNSNLVVRGNVFLLARNYDHFGAVYSTFGLDAINIDTGASEPSVVSDRRLKYVGKEITTGLDKIKQLKVFNYTFKKDEKKTPHVGVIAQDLQKVFPDAVKKGNDGYLTIRMEDMFYALVNAVKELDAKVTQLIKKDSDKDAKIKALEAKNAELEARLKRLEAKIK